MSAPAETTFPAILLAAGLSSRMGDFKPLIPLAGKPLIHHVINTLRGSGAVGDIIVVTGRDRERLEAAVAALPAVHCIHNLAYAHGEMLSSLRAGIVSLAAPPAPGFFLAFADQPAVRPATIAALAAAFAAHPASPYIVPTHHEKRGHPILLSRALIPEIAALAADETLRTITQRHRAASLAIAVPDPAILEDLDTPQDLARAQQSLNP